MLKKMKVFFVALMVCHLFVTNSMASSAYGWFKNNGDDTLHLGVNSTGPNHQYSESGIRKSIVPATHGCYTQFFVGHQPPTGLRPPHAGFITHICQQIDDYNDVDYYATMFDQHIGIAVYAAYVVPNSETEFIGTFPRVSKWVQSPDNTQIPRQGSNLLYHNSGANNIHRGHLVPAQTYSFDCMAMVSTFRYSNAVPQFAAFNTGPWGQYEDRVRRFAEVCRQNHHGDLYLLTGTSEAEFLPAGPPHAQVQALHYYPNDNPAVAANIAIPNSMWTAGCCISSVNGLIIGAIAAIGNNVQVHPAMHQVTVQRLQQILAIGTGGGPVNLFPGNAGCSSNIQQFRFDQLAMHGGGWTKAQALR